MKGFDWNSQAKFALVLSTFQVGMLVLFSLLVRYRNTDTISNGGNSVEHKKQVGEILEKYPMAQDVQVMLFVGFGFLMTYLKRFGYSALVQTLAVITVVVQWTILIRGLLYMDKSEGLIFVTWNDVMEGGFVAAAVLISFGALIGKINYFQLTILALIEVPACVLNAYIGLEILGAVDGGGTIFVHVFGAYFGIFASLTQRLRNYNISNGLFCSRYTSDHFSFIGTLFLWVYWPSFNAYTSSGEARHRALINTYLALSASSVTSLIFSCVFGKEKRMNAVDLQNASLSGGVAVGAVAGLLLQPNSAVIVGCVSGFVSTAGYQVIQNFLVNTINLHDSCGVNNLHGLPGLIGGVLSILMASLAQKKDFGPSLYLIYPEMCPKNGTLEFGNLKVTHPELEPGSGRSAGAQALNQFLALVITFALASLVGIGTGLIISLKSICNPIHDSDLFDDELFFNLPNDPSELEDDTFARYGHKKKSTSDSKISIVHRTSILSSTMADLEEDQSEWTAEGTNNDSKMAATAHQISKGGHSSDQQRRLSHSLRVGPPHITVDTPSIRASPTPSRIDTPLNSRINTPLNTPTPHAHEDWITSVRNASKENCFHDSRGGHVDDVDLGVDMCSLDSI